MSRDELIKILDFENGKPDEMGTDWAVVSRSAALRAMVAAYNKAIDDAAETAQLVTVKETDSECWVEVDKSSILDLKI